MHTPLTAESACRLSGICKVFGCILFLALVVFGIVYCIKTIKNVRRVAREGK